MSFLKAEWRKLLLVNYEITPDLLKDYVPAGTELELWNGKCYVSLVGFRFVNTRLLNIPVPFHINFEEVNLRFYVRCNRDGWRRGVVFIREIVPKPALSLIANTIYNENYVTLPMRHEWKYIRGNLSVSYGWRINRQWQSIGILASPNAEEIGTGTDLEFITEHYWGYTKINDQRTSEYEVTHPRWLHYPVRDFHTDVDFRLTYGEKFARLNRLTPSSVMLAEGSEITVEHKTTIDQGVSGRT